MGEAAVDLSPRGVVADLRNELDRLVAGLDQEPAIKAFKDGSAEKDLYVAFLVQTRHYVALTAPCLEAAGRRLKELGEHPELADLFFQKADEEAGHDILVDDDLRTLGLDPEATLAAHPPGEWITAYNSWITAATNGRHPAAFLGSAYILEGLAVERAGKVAKALVASSNIPKIADAVTFLDLHAEADIGHVDDLERILANLEDPTERDAIVMTAAATRGAYLGMLDEVARTRATAH
ncbi:MULTISPECIES: iron-containing redox enzyme family protein [Methylobacterium]|uniref:Iron-containing redox enzyme family protein n=1 Tax=Methylobacterium thuringiense TaxID=1003091 RepID=A0ABQ4TE58_9HYPH|nr:MULTISPECIES: iron-containing redox enzyme family protein [Methylobacterium]TXN22212.1 iron-containing redox enzyme family protein [Methylobacterium sp. WL9]GJE53581.1 hypothetical protein EKPJFOCH_0046 [Methylobacterium thuringiense]